MMMVMIVMKTLLKHWGGDAEKADDRSDDYDGEDIDDEYDGADCDDEALGGPEGCGEALRKMLVRPGDVPDGIHKLRNEIIYRVR